MENLQQELKSMLYLSGRMNRRSYFMNLLMIFGIGYIGGLSLCIKNFLDVRLADYGVFCCS